MPRDNLQNIKQEGNLQKLCLIFFSAWWPSDKAQESHQPRNSAEGFFFGSLHLDLSNTLFLHTCNDTSSQAGACKISKMFEHASAMSWFLKQLLTRARCSEVPCVALRRPSIKAQMGTNKNSSLRFFLANLAL